MGVGARGKGRDKQSRRVISGYTFLDTEALYVRPALGEVRPPTVLPLRLSEVNLIKPLRVNESSH